MQRAILTGFIAILTVACSGSPIVGVEERRSEAELYREDFIEFRTRCWQQNGRIFIDAKHMLPKHEIPRPGDRYYCI